MQQTKTVENFWSIQREMVGLLVLGVLILLPSVRGGPLHSSTCDSARPCGQSAMLPQSSRIVGGTEAIVGAWPWAVILAEENFAVCGGALIHDRVVLTAAHCFEDPTSQDIRRWQVVAGKHHLGQVDTHTQLFKVERLVMHEHYLHSTVANDIALLLLDHSLTYTDHVRPICLSSEEQKLSTGQECVMAGWGSTEGTGTEFVLNEVTVPIVSDEQCSARDWYGSDFLPVQTFCAGYREGGKDACEGDSGGALVCKSGDRWFARGLASWGYGCGEEKFPGIYTNVSYYLHWIYDNMNELDVQPCLQLIG